MLWRATALSFLWATFESYPFSGFGYTDVEVKHVQWPLPHRYFGKVVRKGDHPFTKRLESLDSHTLTPSLWKPSAKPWPIYNGLKEQCIASLSQQVTINQKPGYCGFCHYMPAVNQITKMRFCLSSSSIELVVFQLLHSHFSVLKPSFSLIVVSIILHIRVYLQMNTSTFPFP